MGLLGIRDIETLNDALLAKLTWSLITNPSSLLGQTLLGKYYSSLSILDCPISSSASHGWRGIMTGREVLKLGLGWMIGDGKSVCLEVTMHISFATSMPNWTTG